VRQAIGLLQEAEASARASSNLPGFSEGLAGFASDAAMMEDATTAGRLADRALALTNPADVAWGVPGIYYKLGRHRDAEAIEVVQAKRFANDRDFTGEWQPVRRAASRLFRGDAAGAVEILRTTERVERAHPHFTLLRGRALLEAGRLDEAATAFQRCIDIRYMAEPTPLGNVCRIWLARTTAKRGDPAAAKRHYQDAIAAWKNADPDLPLLVRAKKEYEALSTKH
jgi:tetratricopeptide (TPR) repeat protein